MQRNSIGLAVVLAAFASVAIADDSAQANNPLASMTAFNLQNYYIGDLSESDANANQAWLRYAKPFSVQDTNWILRASLPVNTFPSAAGGKTTGVGDLNAFAAYLIDVGNPAVSFGVGPQITMPTASKNEVGSEKWSAGLVNVLFDASSPKFQYGYLLTWLASFAGSGNRENVNIGALQPFAFYQLGGGTYLRPHLSGPITSRTMRTAFLLALAWVRSSSTTRLSTIFSSNRRSQSPTEARGSPNGKFSWA